MYLLIGIRLRLPSQPKLKGAKKPSWAKKGPGKRTRHPFRGKDTNARIMHRHHDRVTTGERENVVGFLQRPAIPENVHEVTHVFVIPRAVRYHLSRPLSHSQVVFAFPVAQRFAAGGSSQLATCRRPPM